MESIQSKKDSFSKTTKGRWLGAFQYGIALTIISAVFMIAYSFGLRDNNPLQAIIIIGFSLAIGAMFSVLGYINGPFHISDQALKKYQVQKRISK
ncbi:MAG: hypothetical protein V4478_03130 [Patescibacteria group bacterium]